MYNYQIEENTVLVFERKLRKFLYSYLSSYLLYKHNFITAIPLNIIYCEAYISHKTDCVAVVGSIADISQCKIISTK